MARHLAGRLAGVPPILLVIVTVSFFVMRVAPGGPLDQADVAGHVDIEEKLRLLKRLFEEELITKEEYTAKKAQLLENL